MAAIAGIALANSEAIVQQILQRMAHRGGSNVVVKSIDSATLGLCWPAGQPGAGRTFEEQATVEDRISDTHFASAQVIKANQNVSTAQNDSAKKCIKTGSIVLTSDALGVSPLYYGYTSENALCFASEVKGLVDLVEQVFELPPGSTLKDGVVTRYFMLQAQPAVDDQRLSIAAELRRRLEKSVEKRAARGVPFGSWLSGGLDSSIMAALARPHIDKLHTFAIGFQGAPDLEYARLVARHFDATHHEVLPTMKDVLKVIPTVIYHLESFDALLVRSSLMNYLVAKAASDYVPAVFSGEGGDELFAGYHYLHELALDDLPGEVIDLTGQLHNTALQRVDRCSAAHATIAYLGFLDQEVVDYALQIPAMYKIFNGLEKWILRRAVFDLLPERVALREKAKFWEGAGIEGKVASFAAEQVSEADFRNHIHLPNGEVLNTKEELYHYRIFQEHYGSLKDYNWMGRTKVSPVSESL